MKKIIKNKSNIIAILILIVSITAFLSYNIFFREDTNSSYALSKYVDGIYGSQTLSAVRWFQSKNGLTVDRYSRT